jgi:DNA-binding transcriptional LysR family regulator
MTSQWPGDSAHWFAEAGLPPRSAVSPVAYETRALVFDAVLSGQAMAIFDVRMTAVDEARGRLLRLHPLTVERPQGIHVAFPRRRLANPRMEAFAAWLEQEANLDEPEARKDRSP